MAQAELIVVGAGAAGLMAAARAAAAGAKVLVLERSPKPGAKILISGGGRCNFTNTGADASHYRSSNPHFCKSALSRYRPDEFLGLVRKHGIAFHEKKLGQLFCDRSAKEILQLLLEECAAAGAEIRCGLHLEAVEQAPDKTFRLRAQGGQEFSAPRLILATGGLSFPKLGATDFGYQAARSFGLNVLATSPALDGFLFAPAELKRFAGLAGLSLEARVSCGGKSFDEAVLFTHRGLSGPACLQASLYWEPGLSVELDLLPGQAPLLSFKNSRGSENLKNVLGSLLPKRLAEAWLEGRADAQGPLAELSKEALLGFEKDLKAWTFVPAGTVGYDHAEVTRGGVDTDELSSKTMESHKVPGLYVIGELVDVTGELGGYNFQWAWASAVAAGEAAASFLAQNKAQ
jgi:predicted Rossmann fold flavoprotein